MWRDGKIKSKSCLEKVKYTQQKKNLVRLCYKTIVALENFLSWYWELM